MTEESSRYSNIQSPLIAGKPKHWYARRLRYVAKLIVSNVDKRKSFGESPVRLCNYVDVYRNDVIHSNMSFMSATASSEEIELFRLRKGDVLITKDSEDWKDIGVPAIVTTESPDLICGYHLAILRPYSDVINCQYLFWQILNPTTQAEFSINANGVTRYGLSQGAIKNTWILIPPLQEQISINRFLNYYDSLVKKYIRARKQSIFLLHEQKQTIIQRIVTTGLNSSVQLQPSGIDWTNQIPAHWDVRRIKTLFREIEDKTETGREILLSLRMYKGLVPHNTVSNKPIVSENLIGYKRTQPKEIVMNRMRAASGLFAVTPMSGIVSPDYAIFRQIVDLNPDYFVHLFKTPLMRAKFRSESKGLGTGQSGFLRLYSDRFGIIKVPVPPLEEQNAIVAYLDDELRELNRAIEKINDEVELIREYRTRLISDVVTGKIDVRETARNLPEATFVDEPIEESDSDEELNDNEDLNDISLEENNA